MKRIGSVVAALALAACAQGSDEDNGGGPDAGGHPGFPDAGDHPDDPRPDAIPAPDSAPVAAACTKLDSPDATIGEFPTTYEGTVSGATAWLQVTDGSCAVEEAPYGVAAPGPEQVIELTNLVSGTTYAVRVEADYDAAFYVVTGCGGESSFLPGECLYYTDAQIGDPEVGQFVATESGTAYVIVDYYSASSPSTGTYRLTVIADPQCGDDWDCTAEDPVCDPTTLACAAGYDQCVGDDANETSDDGPIGGTALALVPNTPSVVSGALCGAPEQEADWFRFTAAEGDDVNLTLSWTDASELDLYLYDADGAEVDSLYAYESPDSLRLVDLAAGDYFAKLIRYGDSSTAVTSYTITAAIPECTWSGQCSAGEPVCTGDQVCVAAEAMCAGEGSGDDGDDGASVAHALTMPATVNAKICSAPLGNSIFAGADYSLEEDWYKVDLAVGQTLDASLAWTATPASEDLDLYMLGPDGTTVDYSWFSNPETVSFTATAAGTHYLVIQMYGPSDVAASTSYSVTSTVTGP
ncbi:MAG TPA: PPC domain-containing protein [Kofleriaceae bacterium]|nr:PPC domain-containing protein [Kofleriaceae bacterium]